MRLTVLSVAYPLAAVSADAVGGAEQVLSMLDVGLVEAGHRSIVVACAGSRVRGELVAVPLPPGPLETAHRCAQQRFREAIEAVLRARDVDLVHMHGIDFDAYAPRGAPTLATLHLPPDWYAPNALAPRERFWFHGVSATQDAACPALPGKLPPIANGIPVDALAAHHAKRGFALMLCRLCPEKGVHLALEAAHRADAALLIGGRAYGYAAHQDYVAAHVAPRLDARRRLIGPVDFTRKRRLLAAARCLLVPSLAAETSSLVAMEAAAAGTPVIAFAAGALPEIVEHGRTGFIVRDAADMADAMRHVGDIDPAVCRNAARARFSAGRMTRDYLALYTRLAAEQAQAA